MANKELLYYIKNETNTDELYLIAVTCIERLIKLKRPSAIKAVVDAGTTALFNMLKKQGFS